MKNRLRASKATILGRLIFRLLPVQVMIVAMGYINSLIDGVIASRCISPTTVGVVGLYYSLLRIMEAIGAVVLGGTTVLCGRYMGRGEIGKTNGIFSLNLMVTLLAGGILTAVSIFMPGYTARALGATPELEKALAAYILGYAIGIIPQLLSQQLAFFLQLEQKSRRSYAGIIIMILVNAVLDLLFVTVWKMDVKGLALASSVSNWVYFLIVAQYYLGKDRQISFQPARAEWQDLPALLKIGSSGALLVFCLAVRSVVVNRILLRYSGSDGLSAMTAFNMVAGFLIALPLGMGTVVRMLTSIFVGEEDRESVTDLIRFALTRVLAASAAVGVVVLLLSGPLASLYFQDASSNVFRLTRQLFAIYSVCVPMVLFCSVSTNYFQAVRHIAFVNTVSVFDGFFSMVIPAALLAPRMGAVGVWLSIPIGIGLTALAGPVYSIIRCGHLPRSLSEWLLLHQILREDNSPHLTVTLLKMGDISPMAEKAERFCLQNGIDKKTAYYSALCLEEMTRNIIQFGFGDKRHKHTVQAVLVAGKENILLRIKDDCVPFDPKERAELISGEDPAAHIGIRMVFRLADEVEYQNILGLNVLSIRLARSR